MDVTLSRVADTGFLYGTIHNHTNATISKLTLWIDAEEWREPREYDVAVTVGPRKSVAFRLDIVGSAHVKKFDVRRAMTN
ncbi:MAG TPA: hypothetical protein VFE62_22260 [Gemmataceae bacterium]|nr:hypothetical protein [Gemmataceae bacterium]